MKDFFEDDDDDSFDGLVGHLICVSLLRLLLLLATFRLLLLSQLLVTRLDIGFGKC